MNLYESIKKNVNLVESTDWEGLKAGLNSCKSADDIDELMNETMDSSDYSKYCDYSHEIDDEDKSSLSWAKSELRKLANENLKVVRSAGSTEDKIKDKITKLCAAKGLKVSFSSTDSCMGGTGLGVSIDAGDDELWYEYYPKQTVDGDKYDPEVSTSDGDGDVYDTNAQALKGLVDFIKKDLDNLSVGSSDLDESVGSSDLDESVGSSDLDDGIFDYKVDVHNLYVTNDNNSDYEDIVFGEVSVCCMDNKKVFDQYAVIYFPSLTNGVWLFNPDTDVKGLVNLLYMFDEVRKNYSYNVLWNDTSIKSTNVWGTIDNERLKNVSSVVCDAIEEAIDNAYYSGDPVSLKKFRYQ